MTPETIALAVSMLTLAVSVLTVGGAFVGYGRLQQRVETSEKAIEKLDREKASKDSLVSLRDFLEERFRHVETLITRDREISGPNYRAPGGE